MTDWRNSYQVPATAPHYRHFKPSPDVFFTAEDVESAEVLAGFSSALSAVKKEAGTESNQHLDHSRLHLDDDRLLFEDRAIRSLFFIGEWP